MPVKKLRCIHHNGLQDQHKYKDPKDCGKVAPCSSEDDGKAGVCPNSIPILPPMPCPPNLSKGAADENGVPNIMLCFKSQIQKKEEVKQTVTEQKPDGYRKRAKSRELRAGILYVGCDCERRNGLQDKCPRSECQGSPECLTLPPTCPPSEFANGKHIAKTLWKVQKQQELEAKKDAEKNGTKAGGRKEKDVHYDCFPIDLEGSAECPLCARTLKQQDRGQKKQDMPVIFVGPINIGLAPDCQCCGDEE